MKKLILLSILLIVGCAPKNIIPVGGATSNDWPPNSFWHPNWGTSVVHHGIDIYAKKGTSVLSSTNGIVILAKPWGIKAGNSVMVIGPWFRVHFYFHLDEIHSNIFNLVKRGEKIGTVGDTGNAKGKEPHLHYQIVTPIPYIWRWDNSSRLGWRKIFVLNPVDYILQ